jgi:hypothetical protein
MDEKRKAELRGLCEVATKGYWYWVGDSLVTDDEFPIVLKPCVADGGLAMQDEVALYCKEADRNLIAAARTALPELLDEIKRLKATIARMQNELCSIKPGTYTASTR